MSETEGKFKILVRKLREMSENAEYLPVKDVFAQWKIIERDEGKGMQECLCTTPIKELITIKNIHNRNEAIVGNVCCKKFGDDFVEILKDIAHCDRVNKGLGVRERECKYILCKRCNAVVPKQKMEKHNQTKHAFAIAKETKIPFGQYKGKTLHTMFSITDQTIKKRWLNYVKWAIKTVRDHKDFMKQLVVYCSFYARQG